MGLTKNLLFISVIFQIEHGVNGLALPFEDLYRLDIVHYNDFHARLEETSVEFPKCRFNNNSCFGGFPRLYHEINEVMKEKPDAVLLNAGDTIHGTHWYTYFKWNLTQRFMNMLPHDAHALGNHEFDNGPAGLAPYMKALQAPVLVANMDTSNEPIMQGIYKPSIVIMRKGRKIGIIGLITTETKTSSSPGNVTFSDPGEATKREAKALKEQGVDIIILLSHCGLAIEKQLARDHGEYIDVIVGGHSHSLLWTGVSPSGDEPEGPYPVIIENTADNKHQVLIVQALAYTKYMGNLSVYFDVKGDYVKWDGGPIFLNRDIPEDSQIKEELALYRKKIANVKIGETKSTLNADDCFSGECIIGDMLADALNEYAKKTVNSELEYVSFIQSGDLKSSFPEGTITRGMILELLPCTDKVLSFELKGQYILEALERSVCNGSSFSPQLQVSGLQVTYNVSLPQEGRVTSASTSKGPLQKEQMYLVTTPAYLTYIGNENATFKEGKEKVVTISHYETLVEQYVVDHSPLALQVDGRIQITN